MFNKFMWKHLQNFLIISVVVVLIVGEITGLSIFRIIFGGILVSYFVVTIMLFISSKGKSGKLK